MSKFPRGVTGLALAAVALILFVVVVLAAGATFSDQSPPDPDPDGSAWNWGGTVTNWIEPSKYTCINLSDGTPNSIGALLPCSTSANSGTYSCSLSYTNWNSAGSPSHWQRVATKKQDCSESGANSYVFDTQQGPTAFPPLAVTVASISAHSALGSLLPTLLMVILGVGLILLTFFFLVRVEKKTV